MISGTDHTPGRTGCEEKFFHKWDGSAGFLAIHGKILHNDSSAAPDAAAFAMVRRPASRGIGLLPGK
ncbi:hypothetical protein [Azospirillum palustre]